jgi:hypothetical protein
MFVSVRRFDHIVPLSENEMPSMNNVTMNENALNMDLVFEACDPVYVKPPPEISHSQMTDRILPDATWGEPFAGYGVYEGPASAPTGGNRRSSRPCQGDTEVKHITLGASDIQMVAARCLEDGSYALHMEPADAAAASGRNRYSGTGDDDCICAKSEGGLSQSLHPTNAPAQGELKTTFDPFCCLKKYATGTLSESVSEMRARTCASCDHVHVHLLFPVCRTSFS